MRNRFTSPARDPVRALFSCLLKKYFQNSSFVLLCSPVVLHNKPQPQTIMSMSDIANAVSPPVLNGEEGGNGTTDSLGRYLRDIGKFPFLPDKEVRDMIRKYRLEPKKYSHLRKRVIETNLPLVVFYAKK